MAIDRFSRETSRARLDRRQKHRDRNPLGRQRPRSSSRAGSRPREPQGRRHRDANNAGSVAAKKATTTIPIVMAGSNNPVAEGLVTSITRPGKNVTGVMHSPESGVGQKMVQLLKEAAPRVTRMAVLERATDRGATTLTAASNDLGVVFVMAQAESPEEVPAALAVALRWRANALSISSRFIMVSAAPFQ